MKHSLSLFLKTGCTVCTLLLLSLAVFHVFKPSLSSLPVFARFERKLPIYCVDTDKPQVALSFDAAWGNEDTETLLSILAKYNIKTTFFMTGGWIESYPEDVKKIAAAGHDLGNHSENHKQMSQLSSDDCIAEIQKPHDKVKELTGTEMTLFRPPYGDYNNTLIESANSLGYHVIQWSVDSLDWKDYGAEDIVDRVCHHKNLENGAIILLHTGTKYTAEALPKLLKGWSRRAMDLCH